MLAAGYGLTRPALFQLDPEVSHRLIFNSLALLQRTLELAPFASSVMPDTALQQRICGIDFPNPIGLAAGFDKNAELPHVWSRLGFGFAELGTVSAEAQPGNPRPRLFRLVADGALINRLGFNNQGARAVADALSYRFRYARPALPYGINIGKSRVTPLEQATEDYLTSLRASFSIADYITINVSSPNTPGLRELQSASQLQPLLAALQNENESLARSLERPVRPLFLKIAPEISDSDLHRLVDVATRCRISGFIATNTTTDRTGLQAPPALAAESGGLSGRPLRDRSTSMVTALYRLTEGRLPIIGVGGIFTAADAYAKIRAGATLVQVYTGLIYEGPRLPVTLRQGVKQLLARDGYAHISDAIGRDVHG